MTGIGHPARQGNHKRAKQTTIHNMEEVFHCVYLLNDLPRVLDFSDQSKHSAELSLGGNFGVASILI